MLEIRRITQDELVEADKISTIAFNSRHDFSTAEDPDPLDEPYDWTWGAFENGRMVSRIVDIPFVMRFDGHDAQMCGIGGVSTLPEARRGGKVRRIFEALLTEAYDSGAIFSCLAPFSHAYYRMFGYELCCMRRELRVPIHEFENLRRFAAGGAHEHILPGGDTSGLQQVHAAYISGINHAIRRDTRPDDLMWRKFIKGDPYNTGNFVYLWRNGDGEPRGYIKYQHKNTADGSEINVRELMYLDRESLYAQLAFAGGLSAAAKEFVWEMPMFLDPADFIDVAWTGKQRLSPRDMTRVVNVKAALELMRRPGCGGVGDVTQECRYRDDRPLPAGRDDRPGRPHQNSGTNPACDVHGTDPACEVRGANPACKVRGTNPACEVRAFVLETEDPIIPQNSGRWLVEFGDSGNAVTPTNKDADIVCGLPALAQLVTGYRTLDSMMLTSRQDIDVKKNAEALRAIFTQRPQYVTEYF